MIECETAAGTPVISVSYKTETVNGWYDTIDSMDGIIRWCWELQTINKAQYETLQFLHCIPRTDARTSQWIPTDFRYRISFIVAVDGFLGEEFSRPHEGYRIYL